MTHYSNLYSFDKSVNLSDEDFKGLMSFITPKDGSAKNQLSMKLIEGANKNFLLLAMCVSKTPVIDYVKLKEKFGDSFKQYSGLPKSKKFQTDGVQLRDLLKPLDV
jgi:ferritin